MCKFALQMMVAMLCVLVAECVVCMRTPCVWVIIFLAASSCLMLIFLCGFVCLDNFFCCFCSFPVYASECQLFYLHFCATTNLFRIKAQREKRIYLRDLTNSTGIAFTGQSARTQKHQHQKCHTNGRRAHCVQSIFKPRLFTSILAPGPPIWMLH